MKRGRREVNRRKKGWGPKVPQCRVVGMAQWLLYVNSNSSIAKKREGAGGRRCYCLQDSRGAEGSLAGHLRF